MVHPAPTLLRCCGLAAALVPVGAAELAPSADLGALPVIAPRSWVMMNFAPDDNAVSIQAPRRRELVVGAAQPVGGEGFAVLGEAVWSPMRAEQARPPVRTDELRLGLGGAWEKPMGESAYGMRVSAIGGLRVLGDLGSQSLDDLESRLRHGAQAGDEDAVEHPDRVDPICALNAAARIRLSESDPLRKAPLDLALSLRTTRVIPLDGEGSTLRPDLRGEIALVLPTRTTVSWFGMTWQDLPQPANSRAGSEVRAIEEGWWFTSGGALRVGSGGDWLVEIGSAFDLGQGIAVGTVGMVHTGDPPRASADGTASLEAVVRLAEHMASGFATGDELKRIGDLRLRSEIRALISERSHPAGVDAADSASLDGSLRAQLPLEVLPWLSLGPEAAFGMGVRRDAVAFNDGVIEGVQRLELAGDLGLAARVSTGWKDGIAACEAAVGYGFWKALGGTDRIGHGGAEVALEDGDSAPLLRFGLLALF